jgi:acyl-coenzyme A thioesterase PaaI-like protein
MKNLRKYFEAARKGGWHLWKLNFILGRGIPFNRPHGIKILNLGANEVMTIIPYRNINFNHIRGIHACGLATVAEFASGLLLLNKIDPGKYRIIMQSLEVQYHYQAKADVVATFTISDEVVEEMVVKPLQSADAAFLKCQVELRDSKGNHVATAYTNWQVKSWDKVRTKA